MSQGIQMVDLQTQYAAIKEEIDRAVHEVIDTARFIRGPVVGEFECALCGYLNGAYAVGVANGTDALQVAMMALGIGAGDEVITPAFTFIATAEAAALIGATPVFADINPGTFNVDPKAIESLITERTRAIVPVHLFGQPADMDPIMDIARRHNLAVIEDNAQSVGATYKGRTAGYIGDIGTLSFFPSKNLGGYGDGGACLTESEDLYRRVKMIANHGSQQKYRNEIVGVNSRLDSLQAAILKVKLEHLDAYNAARVAAADRYDAMLKDVAGVTTPIRDPNGTHVFHQYTIRVDQALPGGRDGLSAHLKERDIPHAIYYPVSLLELPVFSGTPTQQLSGCLDETRKACREVLSLPMHTELTAEQQERITSEIAAFASGAAAPVNH